MGTLRIRGVCPRQALMHAGETRQAAGKGAHQLKRRPQPFRGFSMRAVVEFLRGLQQVTWSWLLAVSANASRQLEHIITINETTN